MVLIIAGALTNRIAQVLWVLAVLSNLTVISRMLYTWRETRDLEHAQLRAVQSAPAIDPATRGFTIRQP